MRLLIVLASLALALPLAIVAFVLGNFAVLMSLCIYVTVCSLVFCLDALRVVDSTIATESN